jgi:hypothetical protein
MNGESAGRTRELLLRTHALTGVAREPDHRRLAQARVSEPCEQLRRAAGVARLRINGITPRAQSSSNADS